MSTTSPIRDTPKAATVLVCLLALAACSSGESDSDNSTDPNPGATDVPVIDVSLTPATVNLDVGQSATLSATVTPANATDTAVTWQSSDAAVATVSTAGVVSAVAGGSATITVTTVDGGFNDTSTVNVATPGISVTGVSVSPTIASIDVNGTTLLTAFVTPANAADATVTWSSSDTSVASVDANGLVSGFSVGTSTISVTTIDGGFSSDAVITVTEAQTGDLAIHAGDSVAALIVPQGIDLQENMNFDGATTITSRAYDFFNDDFDFIILVTNSADVPQNITYFGRFYNASNDVEGIGRSVSDSTASFGSSGKLKGVIHLPYRRGILNGPSLHELAHNWANHFLDTGRGSHWGFTGFVGGRGQLGGFDSLTLQDLGGGTYTADSFGLTANRGNSVAYSNLELYLMGMINVSQVSNLTIVENGAFVPNSSNFTADAVVEKTFAQILAEEGLPVRNPPASSSQKIFKVLTLIVTSSPVTNAEFDVVNAGIQWLAGQGDDGDPDNFTFNEATQFIGLLEVGDLSLSRK